MHYSLFWEACESGNLKEVERCFPFINDINKPGPGGWNAIILAAYNHRVDVVKFLFQNGADINSTNLKGTTVFMYAKTKVLNNDNYFFLDLLIDMGADVNLRDKKSDRSVMDYAVEIGDQKLIMYLKDKGAR